MRHLRYLRLKENFVRYFLTPPPHRFWVHSWIFLGGGGHHGTLPKAQSSVNIQALAGIIKGKSLMEMATRGEDGVTIDGAIKLVKFAFCFEQWEVFQVLNDAVLHYLRVGLSIILMDLDSLIEIKL